MITVRWLGLSVMFELGVSVAVQVMPPSLLLRLARSAFGAETSAVAKPLTASLKVNVTVAVSPIFNAASERPMPTVGAVLSIV